MAMPIVLARIDDRLIHGQVIVGWVRNYSINLIIIIDDEISKDKVQLSVLRLTTPPGAQLYALSVNGFIERYNKGIFDNYNVMLIFKDTVALRAISENGVKLPLEMINIGGMRWKEGRIQINQSVSVSAQELEDLLYLNGLGYKLEYRQVLTYEPVDLAPILQKKKGEC
jgi:mannose PTS system EIIAB component